MGRTTRGGRVNVLTCNVSIKLAEALKKRIENIYPCTIYYNVNPIKHTLNVIIDDINESKETIDHIVQFSLAYVQGWDDAEMEQT